MAKSEKVKYVTGKVWLIFPHLEEKQNYKNKLTYSVTAMFPKNSNEAKKLKEVLDKLWKENKLCRKDHYPLVDGDEYTEILYEKGRQVEMYKGNYFIKIGTQFDITVVDGLKQPWTGSDDDIVGNYGKVSFQIGAYDNDGKGLTCFLQGVQVLGKSTLKVQTGFNAADDFTEEPEEAEDLPF
jgi:hypothetical protein